MTKDIETPQELSPMERGSGCAWNTVWTYEIYELSYEDYELRFYIGDSLKYQASFGSYTKARRFMYGLVKGIELMWWNVREYLW